MSFFCLYLCLYLYLCLFVYIYVICVTTAASTEFPCLAAHVRLPILTECLKCLNHEDLYSNEVIQLTSEMLHFQQDRASEDYKEN